MDSHVPPEPNPFEAPQAAAGSSEGPRSSPLKRGVLIVLAVILTPIAAGIGGFCCCLGGFAVGDMLGIDSGGLAIAGFGAGILLGATGVIYGTYRLLKGLDRHPAGSNPLPKEQ